MNSRASRERTIGQMQFGGTVLYVRRIAALIGFAVAASAQELVSQRNLSLPIAKSKLYTARMFRTSTLEFQKRTAGPGYSAQRDLQDILALGGGVPIQVGGETIGGIASSGAGQEQDEACAKAGIAKVGGLLK